jgi:outer membrane protein assembly factor BamB
MAYWRTVTSVSTGVTARPLRLWPGVILAVVLLVLKLVLPLFAPQSTPLGVLGGPLLGLAIGIWWAFFSRVPALERWGGLALVVIALLVTSRFLHASIATGMMGYMFVVYAIPVAALALVGWAVAMRRMGETPRRAALAVAIAIACGAFALLRTGGFSGYIDHDFAWRWTKTPEERLIARGSDVAAAPASAPAPVATPAAPVGVAPAAAPETAKETARAEWPGFRGPARDGIVRGVTIVTDWTSSPPVELWRRPIGPGWSSFAVHGDLIYTQEQRGDDEIVAAYGLKTGAPVWRHRDAARFWESNGGPGPRATPAVEGGRVYALGATGIVNALDAATGAVAWSRNAASDTGAKIPDWGFSGSPLVADGLVVVATSGVLAAYDASSGDRRWIGPAEEAGYTSPQLMTIDGVRQVVFLSGSGLTGVSLADGKPLWQHAWAGYPIVQPSQTPDGGILIAANEMTGVRRLAVARAGGDWSVSERWTTNRLKPWFNDFVVHEGHAYGFDGTILACIDLADGARKWKGGRYGGGQLVLLAEQDVLLVVSEEGELALVSATPDEFKELGRSPGINGKTWNHPVVAGDVLLVRNGEEMAAFRLAKR